MIPLIKSCMIGKTAFARNLCAPLAKDSAVEFGEFNKKDSAVEFGEFSKNAVIATICAFRRAVDRT